MDEQRRQYLLTTPREQLSRNDKRLQTIIKKYGSVANAMQNRNVGSLILGGINGGRHTGNKGFRTWPEGELSAYSKSRPRDARGRFIKQKDV